MYKKIFLYSLFILLSIVKCDQANRQKKSVALVIDTTGSMANEVALVRKTAIEIIEKITNNNAINIEKCILVPFNDPGYGPALTTNDPENFKNEIAKITVTGGGDCRELCLNGINIGLKESLMKSYMYVFTDAEEKDSHLIDQVLELIQQKKTQITFIMTGTCSDGKYEIYKKIAEASFGSVFDVQKNSDLSTFFDYLNEKIEEEAKSENIFIANYPAGHGYKQNILIDETISNVSITVAGTNPQIEVLDPAGHRVTNKEKMRIAMSFPKLKVINLIDPAPGNWTITVGSESEHSLKVSGVTDVRFEYGFFTNSIAEITDRPIEDESTHAVIEIHDEKDKIKELHAVELIDTKGKKISEIALIKTMDDSMYKTKEFDAVEGFFYLAITGVDRSGNKFRRISPTAIKSNTKSKVILDPTLIEKLKKSDNTLWLEYNKRATIECNITEILDPVFSWKFPDGYFIETAGGKVRIAKMSEDDEGVYVCTARNGEEKMERNITVFGYKPPYMIEGLTDKYPKMFSPFELTCHIGGSPLPEITWIHNDFPPTEGYFNITTVDGRSVLSVDSGDWYHSGEYYCIGQNKFGKVTGESYVEMRGGFDDPPHLDPRFG